MKTISEEITRIDTWTDNKKKEFLDAGHGKAYYKSCVIYLNNTHREFVLCATDMRSGHDNELLFVCNLSNLGNPINRRTQELILDEAIDKINNKTA